MQGLTQGRLKEVLVYDPETGYFTRRGRRAGFANGNGYRRITIDGKSYYEHRLAWLYTYGSWPAEDVDHRNTRRDDNRLRNLRDVSRSENNSAKVRPQRNNRSGLLGVHWSTVMNSWAAEIKVAGVRHRLGFFATPEEASAAYQAAKANRQQLKGHI